MICRSRNYKYLHGILGGILIRERVCSSFLLFFSETHLSLYLGLRGKVISASDFMLLNSLVFACRCILSYSDLPHSKVMSLASRVLAGGADFALLSPQLTYLKSNKPVR
jgi:hypothetical protein